MIIAYRTHIARWIKKNKIKKQTHTSTGWASEHVYVSSAQTYARHPIGKVIRTGTTATSRGMSKKGEKHWESKREWERAEDGQRRLQFSFVYGIHQTFRHARREMFEYNSNTNRAHFFEHFRTLIKYKWVHSSKFRVHIIHYEYGWVHFKWIRGHTEYIPTALQYIFICRSATLFQCSFGLEVHFAKIPVVQQQPSVLGMYSICTHLYFKCISFVLTDAPKCSFVFWFLFGWTFFEFHSSALPISRPKPESETKT